MVELALERRGSAIESAATGELLAETYREQYPVLVRILWAILGDHGAAEEAAQEAFIRVFDALKRVEEPEKLAIYLRSTAINVARGQLRRKRNKPQTGLFEVEQQPADPNSAEDRAIVEESAAEVVSALHGLPLRQKECVVLRYYLDLTDSEIATALDLSKGSVKTHLSRGVRSLAKELTVYR